MSEDRPAITGAYSHAYHEWLRLGEEFGGRKIMGFKIAGASVEVYCEWGNKEPRKYLSIPLAATTLEHVKPHTGVMQ